MSMVRQLLCIYLIMVLFLQKNGCMILIYKITMVIVLEVIYLSIIIYTWMDSLYIMLKVKLSKNNVQFVWKMKGKSFSIQIVDIIYVYNVLKDWLNSRNNLYVQNVSIKTGSCQLMKNNIKNIWNSLNIVNRV